MATIPCPACSQPIAANAYFCKHCHASIRGGIAVETMPQLDESKLVEGMTDQQRALFQAELSAVRKEPSTGVVLALLVGGLGIHHFYLGNIIAGVVYIVFCWTFIPTIIAVIEAFIMPARVRLYNSRKAQLIAARIKAASSTSPQQTVS